MHMKTTFKASSIKRIFGIVASSLISAPVLTAQPLPPSQLVVRAPAPMPIPGTPSPEVVVNTGVPDTYAWDGSEYVGLIGSQYYYLGVGKLWLPLSGPRLMHFKDWEKIHHDWRVHAIRNERYRRDSHGTEHPWIARDVDHHDRDAH